MIRRHFDRLRADSARVWALNYAALALVMTGFCAIISGEVDVGSVAALIAVNLGSVAFAGFTANKGDLERYRDALPAVHEAENILLRHRIEQELQDE